MAVKDSSGETDEEGNDKRVLRVFDNSDEIPVLNMPPVSMDIYNNGFKIVYQYSDTIFIKAYGVRTGMICSFCTYLDGNLIPFAITRTKKKDTEMLIPEAQPTVTPDKLAATADLEALQLMYKQSSKATDLTTNKSVIDWLIERQASVTDINHHLQIDNVIIDILK